MNTTSQAMGDGQGSERMYRVSLNGESKVLPQSKAMEYGETLHVKYGGIPKFEEVDGVAASAETQPAPASASAPVVTLTSVQPVASAAAPATVREGEIDEEAKKRIDAQQAVLRAGGITGIGFKGEGGDGDQYFANGTRMMDVGYATQHERKAEHEAALPIDQAAMSLSAIVKAEAREDVEVSAREFANAIDVNGKITVFGKTLTEQAIRGLMAQCNSPALSYILGVRNRISAEMAKPEASTDPDVAVRNVGALRADRAKIADVIRHEALRQYDTRLKLRTRKQPNDVYAVVSPKFSPADAPEVIAQILGGMPKGSKGTFTYHPTSTQWELRASVWTPTPVEKQAVGEPFAGYVSFRARDNGTSKFRGGGGIEILRCLNASVYVAEDSTVDRVHRGRILYDIAAMMVGAQNAINLLCQAWGTNRDVEIPIPVVDDKPVPLSEAIPGFWRYLLSDRKSDLQGVLPGRTKTHVEGLTAHFFQQRRVTDRLVRSDFSQGFTSYIQTLPLPVRKDSEAAIGTWLLSPKTGMRCELEDE